MESKEEMIQEDAQVTKMLAGFKSMSTDDLLKDILRHEKEVKGIDWAQLSVDRSLSHDQVREKANKLAKDYLRGLQKDLAISEDELPEFTKNFLNKPFSSSDLQVMPTWAVNPKEAEEWKKASGDPLMNMITYRLKVLQSLEITSSPSGYAQIMLTIGIISWVKKAYDAYKIARLAGLTQLAAVVRGIQKVTLQATKIFVATVVVAIIAEIILYLMEKEAVVYMVLVNMTDSDLKMAGQHITHGKQMVQFVNSEVTTHEEKTLMKRLVVDLGTEVDIAYYIGLYVAQKRDMALFGTQGAFNFVNTPEFPQGAYVGYEIPLTKFGGDNRCLVSAANEGSLEGFSNKTNSKGKLESESKSAKGRLKGTMHSGGGSKGYMSVIFEPLP